MTKEQIYHNSRTIFAIINDSLRYGPLGFSHADWLIGQLDMSVNTFNETIRGYVDESGIYFYQGDFETNDKVETTALRYADLINKELPIYCGCIKGEVGEKWKPIKKLR